MQNGSGGNLLLRKKPPTQMDCSGEIRSPKRKALVRESVLRKTSVVVRKEQIAQQCLGKLRGASNEPECWRTLGLKEENSLERK